MSSLSDSIELYLLQLLEQSSGAIEIQRNELADRFRCVPSQINYVLATRFSPERGFLIESRRGGGGYVRILRMKLDSPHRILKEMDDTLDQRAALGYVARFKESGFDRKGSSHHYGCFGSPGFEVGIATTGYPAGQFVEGDVTGCA